MPREVFSYSGGLLARPIGERGSVQIDGCRGRRTILYGRGFPGKFDIRSGLLTWDTGRNVVDFNEGEPSNGTVFGYELATRHRHSWKLPRVRIHGEPEPPVGAFGYSTHTANTIFWIASELLDMPEIPGALTSGVYATPVELRYRSWIFASSTRGRVPAISSRDDGRLRPAEPADHELQAAAWDLDPLVDGEGVEGVERRLSDALTRAQAFAERHSGKLEGSTARGCARR